MSDFLEKFKNRILGVSLFEIGLRKLIDQISNLSIELCEGNFTHKLKYKTSYVFGVVISQSDVKFYRDDRLDLSKNDQIDLSKLDYFEITNIELLEDQFINVLCGVKDIFNKQTPISLLCWEDDDD